MTLHYTNQDAHNDITEQFTQFKRTQTDRASRIDFSNRLTERYFTINDKIPPVAVLDRLATLILQDELADPHPDKMTRNEHPLLSDRQWETRIAGEATISDVQYGRDKCIGYVIKAVEDENGVSQEIRKKLYDFPR